MVQGAQRGLFSALSVGPASMASKQQPSIPSTDLFLKMIAKIPHVTTYVMSLRFSCSSNRTKRYYQQLAKALLSFGHLPKSFLLIGNFSWTKRHYLRLEKALLSFSHLTKFAFCLSGYDPEQILESDLSHLIQTSLTLPTLRHVELVNVPLELFPNNTPVKHLVIGFDHPTPEFLQTTTHPQLQPPGRRPTILESLDIDDSDTGAMGHESAINRFLACQNLDISRLTRLHISIEEMEPYDGHDTYINQLLELCGASLQVLKFTPSRYSTLMVVKHSNARYQFLSLLANELDETVAFSSSENVPNIKFS
jgi:hypothetical protein